MAHPQFPCPAIRDASVDFSRREGRLELRYQLGGQMAELCIPERKAAPQPLDELWKHTCFEFFLSLEGDSYLEMNFSPSGDWAVYRFSGYRKLVEKINLRPVIEVYQGADSLDVRVLIEGFPYPLQGAFQACAVLEDRGGRCSYWAIRHPEGKPDFHAQGAWTKLP